MTVSTINLNKINLSSANNKNNTKQAPQQQTYQNKELSFSQSNALKVSSLVFSGYYREPEDLNAIKAGIDAMPKQEVDTISSIETKHHGEIQEKQEKYDAMVAERATIGAKYNEPGNAEKIENINKTLNPLEPWEGLYKKYLDAMQEKQAEGKSWPDAHMEFLKEEQDVNGKKALRESSIKQLREIYQARETQPMTTESINEALRVGEKPEYSELPKTNQNPYLPDEAFEAGKIVENLAHMVSKASGGKAYVERREPIFLNQDPVADKAYNGIIKEFTPIFENAPKETKQKLAALSDIESIKILTQGVQTAVRDESVDKDVLAKEGFDLRKVYQTIAKSDKAPATAVTFYPVLGKVKAQLQSQGDETYNKISERYSASIDKMKQTGFNMADPLFREGWAEKDAFGMLCQKHCSDYMQAPKQLFVEFNSEPSETNEFMTKKSQEIVKKYKDVPHMNIYEMPPPSALEKPLFNSVYKAVYDKFAPKVNTVNGQSTIKLAAAMLDMEFAQINLSKTGKKSRHVPELIQEMRKGTFKPETEREQLFSDMLSLKKSFQGVDKDLDNVSGLLSIAVRRQDGGAQDGTFQKRSFTVKNALLRAVADVCRDEMQGKEFRILKNYNEEKNYPIASIVKPNYNHPPAGQEALKPQVIQKGDQYYFNDKPINENLAKILTKKEEENDK